MGDRRRLVDGANLLAAAAAFGLSVLTAVMLGGAEAERPQRPADAPRGDVPTTASSSLTDATGTRVPLERYQRIASTSMVADQLLRELCEWERVVAFSENASTLERPQRFAGKPTLGTWASVEEILALRPDLLIIASFARPNLVKRLRERGVTVFDLGSMRGLASLLRGIRSVGTLVGVPAAAARLADRVQRRMRAVARGLPASQRQGAIFLSLMGGKLVCGTRGTSFHDVLHHAGLTDLAATRYRGWPRVTAEQVLALDPQVIVTREGMATALCRRAALGTLRACGNQGQVVELPAALVNDPGLSMLPATELLYARVHGAGHGG